MILFFSNMNLSKLSPVRVHQTFLSKTSTHFESIHLNGSPASNQPATFHIRHATDRLSFNHYHRRLPLSFPQNLLSQWLIRIWLMSLASTHIIYQDFEEAQILATVTMTEMMIFFQPEMIQDITTITTANRDSWRHTTQVPWMRNIVKPIITPIHEKFFNENVWQNASPRKVVLFLRFKILLWITS